MKSYHNIPPISTEEMFWSLWIGDGAGAVLDCNKWNIYRKVIKILILIISSSYNKWNIYRKVEYDL